MLHHPWKRFAALGDSITEGYGMDPVEGVEHLPWARRVARALAETQVDLEFRNFGYRNLRAADVRDTQLEPALAFRPDLVAVAAGANDLLYPDFARDQVEADLEPIYAAFAATGATVFTFSFMNLPGSGLLPADGAAVISERMERLHEAIAALARRYGAIYIDTYPDPRSRDPAFFSADLMHANAAGQAYVAERTLAALAARLAGTREAVA